MKYNLNTLLVQVTTLLSVINYAARGVIYDRKTSIEQAAYRRG
jgi:hypothetical protein